MKLTDVEAYKLKFARKGKKMIDLCEKMVLSNFDTSKKFNLLDLNYPLFCCTNNQLVGYTVELFSATKPDHVSDQTIRDISYTIAIHYNIVPYHNYTHGFSVAQVTSQKFQIWVFNKTKKFFWAKLKNLVLLLDVENFRET